MYKTNPWTIISAILITAIVVGGGVYWYLTQELNTPVPVPRNFEENYPEEAEQPVDEPNIYKNEEYGFQVTLTDNWKFYRSESRRMGNSIIIDFSTPTQYSSSGYSELFNISINDRTEWDSDLEKCDKNNPDDPAMCWYSKSEIGRGQNYVFASSHINGDPQEDQWDALNDYEEIISSFRLLD